MANTKPLDPEIPTDVAWQTGRRLYVRCGYKSQLNTALRNLGAHWDGTERALWIGSTKKAAVIEAVQAAETRKQAIQAVKDAGRWVHIPYDAESIRDRAKTLDGVYGGKDHPGWWAMRTDEDLAEITGLVQEWKAQADAARKKREAAAKEDERLAAEASAAHAEEARRARRARLLDRSGRTPQGDTAELREISTRYMNRATAEQQARSLGDLVHLPDGRRGIIIDVDIWFTNDDMASSVCWHDQTHDQAHWDFKYTVAIVEPTDDERAKDAKHAAEIEDAAELNALIEDINKPAAPRQEEWTPIPDENKAGQITVNRGTTQFFDGTLTLTRDGRVIWQHPGYYDDYRHTESVSTDPDLVDRARRLIAAGNRERSHPGMQVAHFTVTVQEQTSA
jgi:hypothetical protein